MSGVFAVTTRTVPTGTVLAFAGELDSGTAPAAHGAMTKLSLNAGDQLVVDLAGLEFCDSSGITVLVSAHNLARGAGAGFALAAVSRQLGRTLDILGLTGLFATYPTADDASAAWSPAGSREDGVV
ncbi:anti-sigma factor antagonist [Lentzea pudingi]|uniref:Anti-sigma factor antagonist n=1 Tax=Lentzea pudingi TaxID=1789439 RepID=A0ABQ2HUU5_9PSEU|nr:STAS domain-containing protein [Lentzea pudingi]GGM88876.1 anti-sigma factor antagonist [Lentzea pudingi]